jgi:ABC-type branched-subunit amino acid transport system substrate-binding protein
MRPTLAARLSSSLFAALCALPAAGCAPESPDTSGIPVGALLPFTGELAAYGPAYERALILAVETVNRSGGIAGQRVRLVARDTHSDTDRGVESARELIDMDIVNVIGPEEPELTLRVASLLTDYDSTQILPSISSPRPGGRTAENNWFHIAPGPRLLGCMIGTRLYLDGRAQVVVVNENDPFLFELASNVSSHYNALLKPGADAHRNTATVLPFQPDEKSYSALISSITSRDADALVLLGYPESSAKIVASWDVGGDGAPLYLSPTLQSAAFRLNCPPGALEGSVGISVDVPGRGREFASAFAARWDGEQPTPMAYFYYDALILWALAFESAYTEAGTLPASSLVQEHLIKVSKEGPNPVGWNEVKKGLALVAAGEGIDYDGASGELDLGDDGELSVGSSATFWRIRGEAVVEDTPGICVTSDP